MLSKCAHRVFMEATPAWRDIYAIFWGLMEIQLLAQEKKKDKDTEDREGREAGNCPHFLGQDTVLL